MNKKLVASLFLYEKEAVTNFDDLTVVSKDPVSLAKMYSEQHADELIIFDLSMGDKEHDEALDLIKEICDSIEIPVIGAGNVKRTEDIKKLLYAGCQKAARKKFKGCTELFKGIQYCTYPGGFRTFWKGKNRSCHRGFEQFHGFFRCN